MNETPSLSYAQKRTVRLLSYEDGLWDLLLGVVFLLLAIYPITRAVLGPAWNLVLSWACCCLPRRSSPPCGAGSRRRA